MGAGFDSADSQGVSRATSHTSRALYIYANPNQSTRTWIISIVSVTLVALIVRAWRWLILLRPVSGGATLWQSVQALLICYASNAVVRSRFTSSMACQRDRLGGCHGNSCSRDVDIPAAGDSSSLLAEHRASLAQMKHVSPWGETQLFIERPDLVDNPVRLIVSHIRVDGQGDDFLAGTLANR